MSAPAITVPQANPGAGYRALQAEIDAAVARALQSGWYILGQEVRAFEAEFAAGSARPRRSAAATAPTRLALALRALGVGPGTSVVTVSHTAVATVAAIEMVGATPLLIDIEPDYYTMDPGELAEVLAHPPAGVPPIRAVIPVHLYGQPAALEPIVAACRRHGVAVIEDCAQAHGATIGGRKVGTFTEVATFSFYPTKNLGALGDGGMLATRDADAGADIAALRQYGWRTHYISDAVGVNSRLDELQAAILRVKLRHLDAQNARRQAIADAYDAALRGTSLRRRRDAPARPRVPPLRGARAGSCCVAGAAARGGHRHRHSLSEPGASAAGVSRTRRARAIGLPGDRDCGRTGAEPADVSGADRRAGGPGLRGAHRER